MADKYQVLMTGRDEHAVIEKKENSSGKDVWEIYIPDAGHRNHAARVARLLNKEHQELLDTRAIREAEEKAAAKRAAEQNS